MNHIFVGTRVTAVTEIVTFENYEICRNTRYGNTHDSGKQQQQKIGVKGADDTVNPLNAELNPIRHLLALVGARHIVRVTRIRVNRTNTAFTANTPINPPAST